MNSYWKDDEELFSIARRELFTAVVGDCMDKLKLTQSSSATWTAFAWCRAPLKPRFSTRPWKKRAARRR